MAEDIQQKRRERIERIALILFGQRTKDGGYAEVPLAAGIGYSASHLSNVLSKREAVTDELELKLVDLARHRAQEFRKAADDAEIAALDLENKLLPPGSTP